MTRRDSPEAGAAALARVRDAWRRDRPPARPDLAVAVRWTLATLAESAPGRSVEVRVPPFAAVQCIYGPTHTRGTPPNTIETDARTWLMLAVGELDWATALADGSVRASGLRADLAGYLPVVDAIPDEGAAAAS